MSGVNVGPRGRPTRSNKWLSKLRVWKFFELGSRSGPLARNEIVQVVRCESLKTSSREE